MVVRLINIIAEA